MTCSSMQWKKSQERPLHTSVQPTYQILWLPVLNELKTEAAMRGQLAQRQVGGRQQQPLEAEAQEVVCGAGAREAQEEHPTAAGQEADARDAREGAVHRAAVAPTFDMTE